jgi:hypothetical protein
MTGYADLTASQMHGRIYIGVANDLGCDINPIRRY